MTNPTSFVFTNPQRILALAALYDYLPPRSKSHLFELTQRLHYAKPNERIELLPEDVDNLVTSLFRLAGMDTSRSDAETLAVRIADATREQEAPWHWAPSPWPDA